MTESSADVNWSSTRNNQKSQRDGSRQPVTDNKKIQGGVNRQRQTDKGKAEKKRQGYIQKKTGRTS